MVELQGHKQAEAVATKAERELREIVDALSALAWTSSPDGAATFGNRHWSEYFGLSVEKLHGWHWTRAVHPDDDEPFIGKGRASLATCEPLEGEARFRRADGQYRWFLIRGVPRRDEQGKILNWYGVGTDIEDRKRAEEAARRRESELREHIEAIPAVTWTAGPGGSCTFISKNWTELTGLSLANALGFGLLTAVHPEDAERHLSRWQEAIEAGVPFEGEV